MFSNNDDLRGLARTGVGQEMEANHIFTSAQRPADHTAGFPVKTKLNSRIEIPNTEYRYGVFDRRKRSCW